MVLVTIATAVLTRPERFPTPKLLILLGFTAVYLAWSLFGIRDAVDILLWESGDAPDPLWSADRRFRIIRYFIIQLGLAGVVYSLADPGVSGELVWLVLLPPVAHSVILMPWPGILAVSLSTMVLLTGNQLWWGEGSPIIISLLAYTFAVFFTVIFSLLAVSSERSRTEVQRLAGELKAANSRLREYAIQAGELAATRERNRMAREIHDSLGHCLTVVNVQLAAGLAVLDRDVNRTREILEKAQTVTREGLREIRHSVSALRSSPLENRPLPEALRRLVAEHSPGGLEVKFQEHGRARPLSPQAELTLFRAGQEGLTNIRRHAGVQQGTLTLDYEKDRVVCLSIGDDGRGVADIENATGGFGLLGLRERAQLLGGEVRVKTHPGAGFILEVEVPG